MLSSSVSIHFICQNMQYFFLYSFLGWLMETVLCSIRQKKFVNRGFLAGPLCPIYGFGMLFLILCLYPLRPYPILLFFSGGLSASLLEYFTSWTMEKLFHAKWWDYQNKKFHLHGRVCLTVSIAWGLLTIIFLEWLHPLLASCLSSIPYPIAIPVVTLLCVIFLADCIQSIIAALYLSKKLKLLEKIDRTMYELETMSLRNRQVRQKKLQELRERLGKQKLNFFQKRLLHAFPQLESIDGKERSQEFRRLYRKNKASRSKEKSRCQTKP